MVEAAIQARAAAWRAAHHLATTGLATVAAALAALLTLSDTSARPILWGVVALIGTPLLVAGGAFVLSFVRWPFAEVERLRGAERLTLVTELGNTRQGLVVQHGQVTRLRERLESALTNPITLAVNAGPVVGPDVQRLPELLGRYAATSEAVPAASSLLRAAALATELERRREQSAQRPEVKAPAPGELDDAIADGIALARECEEAVAEAIAWVGRRQEALGLG